MRAHNESVMRAPFLLPGLALATAALHLLFAHRYGYFRDELYFIACGQRLDWGYVDQPPFIAAAARLATALFGHSLTGLRVLPALAAAGLVALTGHLARRFGGGGFAVALAALPSALAPIFLFEGHTLTMNALEPLLWTGCAALLVHLVHTGQPRLWLALGALAGVGLEDLQPVCAQVELAARVPPSPYVMPYENNLPLYLCSGLKVPLATLWPRVKHYE